jgi:hypothetical protein
MLDVAAFIIHRQWWHTQAMYKLYSKESHWCDSEHSQTSLLRSHADLVPELLQLQMLDQYILLHRLHHSGQWFVQ